MFGLVWCSCRHSLALSHSRSSSWTISLLAHCRILSQIHLTHMATPASFKPVCHSVPSFLRTENQTTNQNQNLPLGFNTGMGKPEVFPKWVAWVRVQYQILAHCSTLRTHTTVSQGFTGILQMYLYYLFILLLHLTVVWYTEARVLSRVWNSAKCPIVRS